MCRVCPGLGGRCCFRLFRRKLDAAQLEPAAQDLLTPEFSEPLEGAALFFREADFESGSPGAAPTHEDKAVVILFHDAASEGEADAPAAALRGEARPKDSLPLRRRNALARILNPNNRLMRLIDEA